MRNAIDESKALHFHVKDIGAKKMQTNTQCKQMDNVTKVIRLLKRKQIG